ncbi:hypothetical protein PHMEG_00015667 [Phytophthora megakarya]|uniref:PX domain-containing protein n=1 Tax=Phytophthora megakarya TaxID=4795 RepID=A0A225W2U1_9STRA|nr:hypothetical protein PHMEG_00015667 [Phytophthora megakarya]
MRLLQGLVALVALALSARYSSTAFLLVHVVMWVASRLLQMLVLLVGSLSFWWVLRSYQLQKEQEMLEQELLKFKHCHRYRSRSHSSFHASDASMTVAGFQLRVLKRLPIGAHLRTSWSLPPEICDEIAALVQLLVKDYVHFWFHALSPNEDFPNDVKFLLADLLGAVASRVLEIDPSQALTMVAKSLELLRLHLGWFREAYAQLAEEYPAVFEGDENDSNLLKRQEYVTAFVQRSPFVHPGCVGTGVPSSPVSSSAGRKSAGENAETAYLRHVATQLLTQLRPQLGQQHYTNVFVSIAMNLLREITTFKILKPLSEYSQPRYANEVVLSCLQAFVDEKDAALLSSAVSSSVYPPPLETSKKARVCGNCYDRLVNKYKLRIEAHVGKYLIKEREREMSDIVSPSNSTGSNTNGVASPTSSSSLGIVGDSTTSPSTSRAGSNKFEITVKVKDDAAYAWSVIKTFHDFEVLEKELSEKLKKQEKKCGAGCQACHLRGVDYMEMTSVQPSLKTVAAATLAYEKRLHVLDQFLQQLLACDTLCQSSIVQKFLLLGNAYGRSLASRSPSTSNWEASESLTSPSPMFSIGGGGLGYSTGVVGSGGSGAGSVLVENGKWRKGRWIAPDANSKETKMRVLQKIEVSLFAVLGEVFEFDGIGMVRRQIFSMTRSFIKAFLGASHFRMLERQFLSFTDPKKLSGWIGDLRVYIFPDPSEIASTPPVPDIQLLRKQCLEAILASFPSKALSLFGDTACENAALKLHEFLQHEVFVKNLLFSITDELLLHLFPDSTTFKGKKSTGGARTSPASPSAIEVATTIAKEAVAASIDDDAAGLITPPLSPIVATTAPDKVMVAI